MDRKLHNLFTTPGISSFLFIKCSKNIIGLHIDGCEWNVLIFSMLIISVRRKRGC